MMQRHRTMQHDEVSIRRVGRASDDAEGFALRARSPRQGSSVRRASVSPGPSTRMKRSRSLPLGEGDGEAELVEFADELAGEALAIGALEVVGAEILIGRAAAEPPVDGGQDRGGDRDDRLVGPAAGAPTGEQGGQVAGFGAGRAPGDLDQEGLEPGGASRRRVERRLPALSSLAGQSPAQEIRCAGVANRLMSQPARWRRGCQ